LKLISKSKTDQIALVGPTWLQFLRTYRTIEYLSDGQNEHGEVPKFQFSISY